MRLTKLDGFQRVNSSNVMVNGGRQLTKRQAKKRGRQIYVGLDDEAKAQALNAVKFESAEQQAHYKKPTVNRLKQSHKIKQKYGLGQIQTQTTESALTQAEIDGSEPSIGFQRVYAGNDPRSRAMNGFGRIKYTTRELQGLSLQGIEILQGYAMGDHDDLEDWNALLSIEHPDTLQGFPNWVLQGKAERKARQAERRRRREAAAQQRAAKKTQRQETRTGKKEARTLRQQKRKARTLADQERRQRRREVRTAKKEERLRLRSLKKEERLKRKQQRLDDRKKRQLERQETKRLRQEARTQRKEARGEQFQESLLTAQDMFSGRDEFQDFSYMDFEPDQFPSGFESQIDMFRQMPGEQYLGTREQIMVDEGFDYDPDDDQYELDPLDAEAPPKKDNTMLLLAGAAAVAVAMSMKKKKKKK